MSSEQFFQDPFEQGTVTACPSRTFLPTEIPDYDLLYLSHRSKSMLMPTIDIIIFSRLPPHSLLHYLTKRGSQGRSSKT